MNPFIVAWFVMVFFFGVLCATAVTSQYAVSVQKKRETEYVYCLLSSHDMKTCVDRHLLREVRK